MMLWFTTKKGGQLGLHSDNIKFAMRVFGVGREFLWIKRRDGFEYEVWFDVNRETWKQFRSVRPLEIGEI
jgi:hypothetical protein